MKLYDVYKNKETNEIIQIDSFATHMNTCDDMLIIFKRIEKHNEFEIGSCPSFNMYGTEEEIEKEYELFVAQEELRKYKDWNEIFELVK
jgi:hypothetical protein